MIACFCVVILKAFILAKKRRKIVMQNACIRSFVSIRLSFIAAVNLIVGELSMIY